MTTKSIDNETASAGKYSSDWWQKRNEERQKKYQSNAKYRRDVQKGNRQSQRRTGVVDGTNVRFKGVENVSRLHDFGQVRTVSVNDVTAREFLTFNTTELSKALGSFSMPVLYSWQQKGILPPPVFLQITNGKKKQPPLYVEEEVLVLIDCLDTHYNDNCYSYIRKDHKDTINLIHGGMNYTRYNLMSGA